jgi:hypothetical protein
MQIFLTGGTGLIGRALCAALLAQNHQLTVFSRRPEQVASLCGSNVMAVNSLARWQPEHCDAVINLAGEPIVDARWTASRKNSLWNSRVLLTQQLLERIQRSEVRPRVLLSGSAIGYYGDCGAQVLDESSSAGGDFSAQLCQAWEQAALSAQDLNLRVCCLRTGLVLAPKGGLLGKMRLPFQWGLGARLGNGEQFMSWIHIDDYVAMVLKLLTDDQANGAFNMTAPHPVTNAEFTQTLAQALHRPSFLFAPKRALQWLLGERAALMLEGQRVLPKKIQQQGYVFQYPQLVSALASLV